ncbi:NifB/NifX family molybdenum-iron cluster-binding protein [Candidatus Magnetobacterium casense]|uniref:Dinitrogenase iron-molybdenum cofactor biosynthesis domain-containing protein n=1 Tax=Candidatus Magnetobacterium casense TaxID=1455061 RepID=A0ABS6RZW0_9BACT|nr:NifB/NifX family molybdenum-iron cluster-binding protein [Candidatus Magnetobacterium casensis]MBV6342149.1 hypothetical protein [Candidatus Magnetobacterium casensis]
MQPGAHLEPGAARPSWSEKEPGAHLERPSWSDKKHGRDKAVEDTRGMGQIHDEVVQDKVEALSDCKILYVTEIGGPSAARLVRQNMMPVKVKAEIKIEDILRELLERIRTSPPPWLRKALQVD